jgi:hypothetical protein
MKKKVIIYKLVFEADDYILYSKANAMNLNNTSPAPILFYKINSIYVYNNMSLMNVRLRTQYCN